VDWPVPVALAKAAPALPTADGYWFEPKYDGHRTILWRTETGVRLQSRSGNDVTAAWPDLAQAGMALEPGCVVDGEAVIWTGYGLDFSATQSRAKSSPARARTLATLHPASFAVWDLLNHPALGDIRRLPYTERRRLLLDVIPNVPPIQVTAATDSRETALIWYRDLRALNIEGIMAKRGNGTYPREAKRIWAKVRHAETVDAEVIGYTGTPARPHALVVRLPDGRRALTQRIAPALRASAAPYLTASGPGERARTDRREAYTTTAAGLTVEVEAGSTRHAVVRVTRLR
jgi:ATP-dependent DNA ligase